jgi:hypothetical protein
MKHKGLNGEDRSSTRCVHVVRLEQGTRQLGDAQRDPRKKIGDRQLEAVDVNQDVHRAVARMKSHGLLHRKCGE